MFLLSLSQQSVSVILFSAQNHTSYRKCRYTFQMKFIRCWSLLVMILVLMEVASACNSIRVKPRIPEIDKQIETSEKELRHLIDLPIRCPKGKIFVARHCRNFTNP